MVEGKIVWWTFAVCSTKKSVITSINRGTLTHRSGFAGQTFNTRHDWDAEVAVCRTRRQEAVHRESYWLIASTVSIKCKLTWLARRMCPKDKQNKKTKGPHTALDFGLFAVVLSLTIACGRQKSHARCMLMVFPGFRTCAYTAGG